MNLVAGHPDRMGYFYRFPHLCPGAQVCAIKRFLRRRNRLGERRVFVRRVRHIEIAKKPVDIEMEWSVK